MMQRAKIRGADIAPNPAQINRINAEKCIAYLRGIGIDISDEDADAWLDTQAVHRLLNGMKRARYQFRWTSCKCGCLGYFYVVERGKRVKTRRVTKDDDSAFCAVCKRFANVSDRLMYIVCVDGTERDYRDGPDRVIAFPWEQLLSEREEDDA